jgi:K+-transporting ATPase ATPase C chain
MRLPSSIAQHLVAVRLLLVLTVLTGIAYPLLITGVAQLPGLRAKADGSLIKDGPRTVGSKLIGQSFTTAHGDPLAQYFQSRPSAAGDGYDPTSSGASNLGPDSIVDTLANPADSADAGRLSLLSEVCSRSLAVGRLDGVSGARPYCTSGGVGAVLGVFHREGGTGPVIRVVSLDQECPATPFEASYQGVPVTCAHYGADYSKAVVVAVRGPAPSTPAVPADAVTASGSGLGPGISPAYARLQAATVARTRGITLSQADALITRNTTGRALGFMGEPWVNVVTLNHQLDQKYPYRK